MAKKLALLLIRLICIGGSAQAQSSRADDAERLVAAIDSNHMRAHLSVLSHDSLEGRGPDTPGGRKAADYIAARFRELGLVPAGDGGTYFHNLRSLTNRVRRVNARNVVARLQGTGPAASEVVIIGAHYDHLGIGPPVNGDSIYNGAEDNAGGAAQLLAVAEAFARSGARPNRSILFIGFDGEEIDLLGSAAFVARPTVPLGDQVAMINLDAANLYGATRDAAALGLKESTLDGSFRRAAEAEGMIVPAALPDSIEAFFLRSDQLPFAQAGVPATFVFVGWDFVGRTPAWASRMWSDYFEQRYHRPSDQMQTWFSMAGAMQQARVVARMALEIANSPGRPEWVPGSQFRRR